MALIGVNGRLNFALTRDTERLLNGWEDFDVNAHFLHPDDGVNASELDAVTGLGDLTVRPPTTQQPAMGRNHRCARDAAATLPGANRRLQPSRAA